VLPSAPWSAVVSAATAAGTEKAARDADIKTKAINRIKVIEYLLERLASGRKKLRYPRR
jgi:hypothetical protein